mgnify:CR=1 FL=1
MEQPTQALISIHAPTRGATYRFRVRKQPIRISIHAPTRGATLPIGNFFRPMSISIHAPTRGATSFFEYKNNSQRISIHAPTRGATFCVDHIRSIVRFQSTLPRGERHNMCIFSLYIYDFNPRSHEGSDTFQIFETH